MAHTHEDGVRSTAAINGHPIHPMLVPLPIGALVGAFVTDLVYLVEDDTFWSTASEWLLLAGVVTGALAAVFGLTDFVTIKRVRDHRDGWIHFLGNATAIVLTIINLLVRSGETGVPTAGVILSAIVAGILVVTGWYGGELSYRHKVGVIPHEEHLETPM